MTLTSGLPEKALRAKAASLALLYASEQQKNLVLNEISKAILDRVKDIREANQKDLSQVDSHRKRDIELESFEVLVRNIFNVMEQPELMGDVFDSAELENGLKLTKYRSPIGVLGLVLDRSPKTLINTAALAIKSGNPLIIWSGKDLEATSRIFVHIIQTALEIADLPVDAVQILKENDEETLLEFIRFQSSIDLMLLKGSSHLTDFCRKNCTIPLICEQRAVCHLYIDQKVTLEKAKNVIVNAKTQNSLADNSISTLLIHEAHLQTLLPDVLVSLKEKGISFRLDSKSWNVWVGLFPDTEKAELAEARDWDVSSQGNLLNIKIVSQMEEALQHIQKHGTGYCEGIISDHPLQAMIFASFVQSSAVLINTSTRFYDGTEMHLGPQALVSTQKFPLTGPIGIKELMGYKWLIQGNYQIYE